MCRFLIYAAKPHRATVMASLVLYPEFSIVAQSYDSHMRTDHHVLPNHLNADGFGVGWYSPGVTSDPCVFTSTLPAWNNKNLWQLAEKVSSQLMFAHVRAATPGSSVTDTNCHPFSYGPYLFMHNGGISDFPKLKRRLVLELSDDIYQSISGTTDSEHAFALLLNELASKNPGAVPKPRAYGQFREVAAKGRPSCTTSQLEQAMLDTLRSLRRLRKEAGLEGAASSSLNFAVSNGEAVVVSRYNESPDVVPATLYFSAGTEFRRTADGQYRMAQRDRLEEVAIVASEPLTSAAEDWVEIPRNTLLTITPQLNILMRPIDL